MKPKSSIKQYGIAVVIAFALVFGVSTLEAAGWSAPPGSPPSGNVDAPVNIGLNTQSKAGQLQINTDPNNPYAVGLQVFGNSIFNGNVQIGTTTGNKYATIQIIDGNQGAGKVLTSDINGVAGWQTPSSSGSSHSFGGMFDNSNNGNGVRSYPNPITGTYGCPAGYTTSVISQWDDAGGYNHNLYSCWK